MRGTSGASGVEARVAVVPPYRLDLTVAALRRLPSNPVDVWTADGRYLRAFDGPEGPVAWEVAQPAGRRSLALRLHGRVRDEDAWIALARRMLGCDVELAGFRALAPRLPGVAALADRYRGLKPPRFASLWETLVNAIAFQQVSLASGMAAVRRLAERCARPIELAGARLLPFPAADAVAALGDGDLRACGLSGAKARALRAAAAAVRSGALEEGALARLSDEDAAARLLELPGVGPWTSALVLLRGLGRLSVFPAGDAGAIRRLATVLGVTDAAPLLARLDGWRGMLYFLLLLASRDAGYAAAPPEPARRKP